MRHLLPFLFMAGLTACSPVDPIDTGASGMLEDGFEVDLDSKSGCSDTWIQLWDADGDIGLEVYREGPLTTAIAGGGLDELLEIGVDEISVWVEVADPVSINYCTDALSERTVHDAYEAISGTVRLTMTEPLDENAPGIAGVILTDVVLENADGHQITVESLAVDEITIVRWWGG